MEWLRVECVDYGVATGRVCGLWSGYGWSVWTIEWLRVECVDYGVATGGVCGLWSGYG